MSALPKGTITVRLLEDGTVRIETGDMHGITHAAADAFLRDAARLLGGEEIVEKAEHGHHHHHDYEHGHDYHHH